MDSGVKQMLLAVIPYSIILWALCALGYINRAVILKIYVPIFLIAAIAIVIKKYYLGHIFIIFAETGLILEYVIYLLRKGKPSMYGAFVNSILLFTGFVGGIVIQILVDENKS